MSATIFECVERSIQHATVVQRLCQGELCTPIENFHVDRAVLNAGVMHLMESIIEDLEAVQSVGGNLLDTRVTNDKPSGENKGA